ncbi:DUF2891 domain-containing protein [Salinimicrobium oceani]|uniref:DUF2891 domain-containing protein n=1 Tax=Salinimicrobium oceani TaxID=2722702 RepID=A0ABX1CSQ1_9FLAO|nr:DUF2891 domain-containing protein [Salinimicrobium oceani]NJW51310.1 DUF2891 domain-containing protein [Salinimicrobium oceani]
MKRTIICIAALALVSCKGDNGTNSEGGVDRDSTLVDEAVAMLEKPKTVVLSLEEANKLAQLPLDCITVEYPNKLNQTLSGADELGEPRELHPAFYGCFDWHSSVHGHWALVSLLKQFPELKRADEIRELLKASLSEENIRAEVNYFSNEQESSFERTYGWAWVLKLAQELQSWEDPLGTELSQNLQPLTDLMVQKFREFLPKLNYPIRVGEHTNTAFALVLARDYAVANNQEELKSLIDKRARDYYLNDDHCPIAWEPGGFDFLSPCLSEIDLMRRVLAKNAFRLWMEDFMPQLKNNNFTLEVAEVSDRTDGKLVHLDGLNFSRAWVLYGLSAQYPQQYGHLRALADEHVAHSFPNLVGDTYEGGHWLGTFALYAIQESSDKD